MSTTHEKIRIIRATISKRRYGDREELELLALLRGWPLARIEQRNSEHNLPQIHRVRRCWIELFGKDEPEPAELADWLKVPEERIKRFGPRVPKIRGSNRNAAE